MSFYEIETPLIAKHNVGKALRAMKETIAEDKLPDISLPVMRM